MTEGLQPELPVSTDAHEPWCNLGEYGDGGECSCGPLTLEEAKRQGLMLDGIHEYHPGINCHTCGRFVGRDGYIGVEHFEMSSEIASIEGQCRKCIDESCSTHGQIDCKRCAA